MTDLRICVIGGGIAGALLAWRLASYRTDVAVYLVPGAPDAADATRASGGYVRAFETDAAQRRLATASLAELLDNKVLRIWSGYRRAGSVYVLGDAADAPDPEALAEIDTAVPGSVRIAGTGELAAAGWSGLPESVVAVLEDEAGYISPHRLRLGVIADFTRMMTRFSGGVLDGGCRRIELGAAVAVAGGDGAVREYDLVVVAAGPWTQELLHRQGFADLGLRTKAIQYTVHSASGIRPPPFVDETSGLYGRPTEDGGLLLGLPTAAWDVDPHQNTEVPGLAAEALRIARTRFPDCRIGAPRLTAIASDCYGEPAGLALRPVPGSGGRLFAFAGGSGGSAKTALAASHLAAGALVGHGAGGPITDPARTRPHPDRMENDPS